MDNQSTIIKEVRALCHGLLEDALDQSQLARLDELVSADSEARRVYIELMNLHNTLTRNRASALIQGNEIQDTCSTEESSAPFSTPCSSQDPAPFDGCNNDEEPLGPSPEASPSSPSFYTVVTEVIAESLPTTVKTVLGNPSFIAGTLTFSIGMFFVMLFMLLPGGDVESQGPLACVSQTVDAVWSNVTDGVELNEISAGKLLKLESGLAQVKYQNGVLVNLQGPCSFVVSGSNQGLLLEGALSALVKGEATGFAVLTPIGKVTDLGTEFGVKVSKNHDTQVQTFQGLVRLDVARVGYKSVNASMPAQSLEIRRGEAVEVDAEQRVVKPVYYAPDQFVRSYEKLKPLEKQKPLTLAGNFAGVFHQGDAPERDVEKALENDASGLSEKRSAQSRKTLQSTLLAVGEVFVADLPAPEPGRDVLVLLSTRINAPQGGPGGGIGFQLRRRYLEGIEVQQNGLNQESVTVEDSKIDDPTPGEQLRFVIKRSGQTEFVFYYQVSGIRTKIVGPIANPELQRVEDFFAGVAIVTQEID